MKKYRIIEVQENNKVHYEIQYKWLIFWLMETEYNISEVGTKTDVIEFKTIQEAKDYINSKNNLRKIKIVFYENGK